MLTAPCVDQFPDGFRKEDYELRTLTFAEYYGLIFVTCDGAAPPLEDYLGEAGDFLAKAVGGGVPLKLLGY